VVTPKLNQLAWQFSCVFRDKDEDISFFVIDQDASVLLGLATLAR